MKIVYIVPHLLKYGGIRRIIEICNALHDDGHDIFIASEQYPDTCDWIVVKPPIISLDDMAGVKWDVAIFSLESQWKTLTRLQARAVIHYILHYGVIYKDKADCIASYAQPTYKITNSNWTSKNLFVHLKYITPVVHGWVNKKLFHPVDTPKVYDVLTYGDTTREWKGRGDVEVLEDDMPHLRFGYMSDINPQQTMIARVYSSSRIFLSASWHEGWNWMAFEAMACGVPVIITNDGGSSDYAKHGYNCLKVGVGEIEEMKYAVNRLIKDPPFATMLARNGLKTVEEYNKLSAIKSLTKHINEAIKREEEAQYKTDWYTRFHRA